MCRQNRIWAQSIRLAVCCNRPSLGQDKTIRSLLPDQQTRNRSEDGVLQIAPGPLFCRYAPCLQIIAEQLVSFQTDCFLEIAAEVAEIVRRLLPEVPVHAFLRQAADILPFDIVIKGQLQLGVQADRDRRSSQIVYFPPMLIEAEVEQILLKDLRLGDPAYPGEFSQFISLVQPYDRFMGIAQGKCPAQMFLRFSSLDAVLSPVRPLFLRLQQFLDLLRVSIPADYGQHGGVTRSVQMIAQRIDRFTQGVAGQLFRGCIGFPVNLYPRFQLFSVAHQDIFQQRLRCIVSVLQFHGRNLHPDQLHVPEFFLSACVLKGLCPAAVFR